MSAAPLVLTDEFSQALALLESGSNLFLTGKAGTGKSTLVRQFLATTWRRVLVAAPTGIAALNVEGTTLHRLFGFHPGTDLEEVSTGRYRPGRFAASIKALETLVIDEASMVRADVFDMVGAALERFGPHPGLPFGGVQVVLVGDPLQLPPVVSNAERSFFTTRYPSPYFFSADRFDPATFPTVTLTQVFRQSGDEVLRDLLNAIREGVLLDHARGVLNTRTDPDFVPPEDEYWLTLAATNRLAGATNRRRLDALPGEVVLSQAWESGDLTGFDPPTERDLELKVGAQVMMVSNDAGERWVNGTVGRVLAVWSRDGVPVVRVEFRDGSSAEVSPFRWEATRPALTGDRLLREVVGSWTQLPMKLAWAITIHKSQGQTLDRVVVDLTGGAFDHGQTYVALSRCTSLAGLVLTRPVLPRDLKVDRRVLRHLRQSSLGTAVRPCGIGVLSVGEEGRMSRPRPVEVAIAFEDGTSISTLVNPQRDLADARSAYGIGTDEVILAPTLDLAWRLLGPLLEGCTPVGPGSDDLLGLLDAELKRQGRVVAMPLALEVATADLHPGLRAALAGPSALERARAALAAFQLSEPSGGEPFSAYEGTDAGEGYLLSRDPETEAPAVPGAAQLSDAVTLSRALAALLLDGGEARPTVAASAVLREVLSDQLGTAAARIPQLPATVRERLATVDDHLGTTVLAHVPEPTTAPALVDVLFAGARVCFTGTARHHGRDWAREDLTQLAAERGLVPVATVTKTRCDVLVVAEAGTQSGKARKAADYGKAVITAEDFLTWAEA